MAPRRAPRFARRRAGQRRSSTRSAPVIVICRSPGRSAPIVYEVSAGNSHLSIAGEVSADRLRSHYPQYAPRNEHTLTKTRPIYEQSSLYSFRRCVGDLGVFFPHKAGAWCVRPVGRILVGPFTPFTSSCLRPACDDPAMRAMMRRPRCDACDDGRIVRLL
jgi:hypothetical protein